MTYTSKDTSVASGEPFECYQFVAAHKTWRFTSHAEPQTVNGLLFTPLPISRTTIETGSIIDTLQTMDFQLPGDHELARTFCYTISPKSLQVTVLRAHIGEDLSTQFRVEWIGDLSGTDTSGKWAIIKTGNKLQTALGGNLSSVYYQKLCNHVLFDERCKVVKATYTVSTTVNKIQDQIITVDDDGFADDALISGVMKNTRTGEEQGILSNNTNILRVGYRFFDLLVGDTVELTRGCDHLRLGDCKTVFNNVPNYGGFDFVPEVNPFEELDFTTRTSTTTNTRENRNRNVGFPPDGAKYV